jgi:adenosylmethionine-8-amino-7-oxononanoate aminotransferase
VITRFAFEEGLIIYPRRNFAGIKGDHVLIAPPLIITKDELAALLERFDKALSRLEGCLEQQTA